MPHISQVWQFKRMHIYCISNSLRSSHNCNGVCLCLCLCAIENGKMCANYFRIQLISLVEWAFMWYHVESHQKPIYCRRSTMKCFSGVQNYPSIENSHELGNLMPARIQAYTNEWILNVQGFRCWLFAAAMMNNKHKYFWLENLTNRKMWWGMWIVE